MDPNTRQLLADVREAALASLFVGVVVAALYRLVMGDLPWSFVGGEFVGVLLGFGLLVSTAPRRRL